MAAGRTTLLVAAAGYGKTTMLEGRGAGRAPFLASAADWPDTGPAPAHLALDDLSTLPISAQLLLAERLRALPASTTVTVAARHPVAPAVLAALPGPVTEVGAADLALPAAEVARVLGQEHGVTDAGLAVIVHNLTAGWPALVHLCGETLGGDGPGGLDGEDLLEALAGPGTTAAAWVRDHVLADLPEQSLHLLAEVAGLEPIDAPLACALSAAEPEAAEAAIDRLRQYGVLVPGRVPFTPPGRGLRLVPIVAMALANCRDGVCGTEADRLRRLRTAADWYTTAGLPLPAARAYAQAGEPGRCAEVMTMRGDDMLAAGGAAEVSRLAAALPDQARTPEIRLLAADAHRMAGDVAAAERGFTRLLAEAQPAGRLPARLAWRAAMLRYLRADYHGALDLLDHAEPAGTPPCSDDVRLLACRATVLVLLGESADAGAVAAAALAGAAGPGQLAVAHLAAALAATGVRREAHLAAALSAAVDAADVVSQARALVNQSDCHLRAANYPAALAAARRAADLGGPPGAMIAALHNAGEALTWLGRYDEAVHHFEWAMQVARRISPTRGAAGLRGLGEVYRQLGRREQSLSAFEEAAELARECSDVQILVPALGSLARLHAEGARVDLPAARLAAEAAGRDAPPAFRPVALVAQGWVALAGGEIAEARDRAAEAAGYARATRRGDLIAGALELAAAAATDPAAAGAALDEATAIWRRAGAGPAADRLLVLRGRLPGADTSQRLAARAATDRLLALGVIAISGQPLTPGEALNAPVRIFVLGRFDVLVGGRPVPLPSWRSRQARTLLKILVARRSRAVPRPELCELLWPDDEPRRTAHRLSVLLSAVRTVLDPERRRPADHYVRADSAGMSLNATTVCVDAEELIRDVNHADDLVRAGDPEAARLVLADVDAAYRGDAFDDEPYEDWADPLRELTRAAWLHGLRRFAALSRAAGDLNRAATCLVRLLAVDPFDDSAHRALVRALVAAGRHGEARRAYDRWATAMRQIDAPGPDRAVLAAPVPAPLAQQAYGPA